MIWTRLGTSCSRSAVRPLGWVTLALLALLSGAVHASGASVDEALVAFREGYYELAARDLKATLAADPGNLEALYWLARCEIATGSFAGAELNLRKVIGAKPQAVDSRYWLGEALAGQNRAEEAQAVFQQVLQAEPGHCLARDALDRLERQPERVIRFEPGGRSGFSVSGLDMDFNAVELLSSNVHDYTFSTAPTDWIARSGVWNATSRWSCSPQWSWFGGYSPDGIAALWNKREFTGDVVVDMYFAFTMRHGRSPSYLPPGDVNITICGDGANPESGYSFIVGGDGNRVTRIMRGCKTLAESRDTAALFPIYEDGQPSTYDWHRKWWSIRARKTGNTLQLYLDNKLVLEAEDQDPLRLGRVAIWTVRNDVITPRIKIYYEDERRIRSPLPDDAPMPVAADPSPATIRLSSHTHPSLQEDFTNGTGSFRTRDGDQGAHLDIVTDGPDGDNCLRLTNTAAGGSFAAGLHRQQFDAAKLSKLSFDYRINPQAKVNIYLTSGGEQYQITFNGPSRPARDHILLGSIDEVKADGQWHRAEFDLLGHLKALMPDRQSFVCTDLWFGYGGKHDYLLAGFGGNHMNATWYMDNFMLGRPAGSELELDIMPLATGIKGYAVALNREPHGAPPPKLTTEDKSVTHQIDDEGPWYAHVTPLLPDEQWGATVAYRGAVDSQPPTIRSVSPSPGAAVTDGVIQVKLDDPGGSGVDLETLQVRFNDRPLTLADTGVSWQPAVQMLHLDLGAAGVVLEHRQSATLEVEQLVDRAGNTAEVQQFAFTVDHKQDRTPPSAPMMDMADAYLIDDTFEHNMGDWTSTGRGDGARLYLDDTTAVEGNRSLRVYNAAWGSRFSVRATDKRFDAGKHRIVSFHYKLDDRVRVDFGFYVDGELKGVRFTDNDSTLPIIGAVPDVKTDGRWHHAKFDLYEMLTEHAPNAQNFEVRGILLADWGHAGNREGAQYWIDGFRIIPIVSGTEPLPIKWTSTDASGVAGVSWVAAGHSAAIPPRKLMAEEPTFSVPLADMWLQWVSVRAQDRAGNWGATTNRPLLVDGRAPVAGISGPPPESITAVSEMIINLQDTGAADIDPSSILLRVAGTDYTVANEGLHYSRQRRQLVWNCEDVSPEPVVFEDGREVQVALVTAADHAGNPVESLPAWSWTMSYAADREGPVIRSITSATHPTLLSDTFEDGPGDWANRGGARGADVSLDKSAAASGEASVKLTNRSAGGAMSATIYNAGYSAEQYPFLAFDYKIPVGVKLDVGVMMDGRWQWIGLTGDSRDHVGTFEDVKADDKWHRASFNLGTALRRQKRQGPLVVTQIMVGNPSGGGNSQGAVANFDNFFIGNVGNREPIVRWTATDTTGIQAYSYVLDQDPLTVPDTASEGVATAKQFERPEQGPWYFHLRAQDGAGNWGPTSTYLLMHGRP